MKTGGSHDGSREPTRQLRAPPAPQAAHFLSAFSVQCGDAGPKTVLCLALAAPPRPWRTDGVFSPARPPPPLDGAWTARFFASSVFTDASTASSRPLPLVCCVPSPPPLHTSYRELDYTAWQSPPCHTR